MDVLFGLAALGVTVFLLAYFGPRYLRIRGKRVVTCPENREAAEVDVGAAKAAMGAGFRLTDCTRWPERESCGQECLAQINAARDGCLVRERLAAWYAGKNCVYCHAPLSEIEWHEHRPCVLAPDGGLLEWHELSPAQIAGGLEGCQPVCWRCHLAESFRRRYPELVIDR